MNNFEKFELLIYFITTILISTAMVMIIPFVSIYTHGITDVNYIRPTFGVLVCISIYFTCIKIPYEQIVYAAGEFKKTRNGAFAEAGINIVLSVVLACVMGLDGIIIGTIIALSYRTTRYHYFICKNIINRDFISIFYRYLYSFLVIVICMISSKILPLSGVNSYLKWIMFASISAIFSIAIATILGFLFFRNNMAMVFKSIIQILKNRKR